MISEKDCFSFHFTHKLPSTFCLFFCAFLFSFLSVHSTNLELKITKSYLNIPVNEISRMKLVQISVNGNLKREFPVQLAEDTIDNYWIYIDVTEFKGKTISLSCPAKAEWLRRIYQDNQIAGSDSLYKEKYRPQFHFTVKRGWTNDINGPIYYNNQYHMFWQSFPFGKSWNTGFMYWGHAVSNDLMHWKELPIALRLDSLGSPWSGTAVVDKNNSGGWGKGALVLYYTAYDRYSFKQVQCIAYSTDGGNTFQRYADNPIIDSNREVDSNDTRDPKVFWYEPTKKWVMVLFERDGMSFYNSDNMRDWKKQSHFPHLAECPDFFELPVDGNPAHKKWVLHGGSVGYYIGDFDGSKFTPEVGEVRYGEIEDESDNDLLYAAQSFENMPDGRRVQVGWGRIQHPGMPFTQMILFPTEFKLKTTDQGLRLFATPIAEIEQLHNKGFVWNSLNVQEANKNLQQITPGPLHIQATFSLEKGHSFRLYYQGNKLVTLNSDELPKGENKIEILIDKTVAEIYVNDGARYFVRQIKPANTRDGLVFESEKYGPYFNRLSVYEMKSIWQ